MSATTQPRLFLIVADTTPEMTVALRYAAWRAMHIGGQVAMLHVIEPDDINHWGMVNEAIMAEAEAQARQKLQPFETFTQNMTGKPLILYFRRGDKRLELLKLLETQAEISVLVLGAHTGVKGPGPLVSYLTSARGMRKLKIPLIIVPDTYALDDDNIVV